MGTNQASDSRYLFYLKLAITFQLIDKIENGNGECVKETTLDQEAENSRRPPNGSQIQRENPIPRIMLQLFLNLLKSSFLYLA